MGEGLLYSKSSGGLIYYGGRFTIINLPGVNLLWGEGLLYDTGFTIVFRCDRPPLTRGLIFLPNLSFYLCGVI